MVVRSPHTWSYLLDDEELKKLAKESKPRKGSRQRREPRGEGNVVAERWDRKVKQAQKVLDVTSSGIVKATDLTKQGVKAIGDWRTSNKAWRTGNRNWLGTGKRAGRPAVITRGSKIANKRRDVLLKQEREAELAAAAEKLSGVDFSVPYPNFDRLSKADQKKFNDLIDKPTPTQMSLIGDLPDTDPGKNNVNNLEGQKRQIEHEAWNVGNEWMARAGARQSSSKGSVARNIYERDKEKWDAKWKSKEERNQEAKEDRTGTPISDTPESKVRDTSVQESTKKIQFTPNKSKNVESNPDRLTNPNANISSNFSDAVKDKLGGSTIKKLKTMANPKAEGFAGSWLRFGARLASSLLGPKNTKVDWARNRKDVGVANILDAARKPWEEDDLYMT